ncbi:MAG TPA: uroporphyrinogen decarboxylase family protein [Candidatus Hydrogenedentes bacterium]|nr:uroporphyrinogen decarboxylase family protein [Candidatus Hydrogenedentota bacterium]HQE83990.1 uroporphyrinogen decarboxylase family protein [Candidatus Hydrogenedentota bacterium]HQM50546.1 uroporphyrinogen decarboxylase family protein [Candidatus Hydrogenedentota bacterium]
MTGRERVLAMIEGREVDHLPLMPITMMFAADLMGVKYGKYASNHDVLAEAQSRVAEAFGFDFVSAISDPAREAADCGAAIEWFEDQPPAVDESHALLQRPEDLARLSIPDPLGGGRMHDRVKGVALLKKRVGNERIVEGWVEGPVAEAADLRGINHIMMDFFERPEFVRDLFDFIIEMELAFAQAQKDAGAELMGVGDAAASLVGPQIYEEFVWPAEKRLVDGLHAMGLKVRLHICGDTRAILKGMGRLGCDIVDLDFLAPAAQGRAAMGPDQVILGNLDPVRCLRDGSPESVREAIARCHREAGARFIVSAGCEVVRDTPRENLRALCEYARETK